jgi:hypothetical protein
MKRQLDGTLRGAQRPIVVSAPTLRARWVEAEVIALRSMGLRLEDIAKHITRVGRGQQKPITPLSDDRVFEPNYSISRQACHKAFNKAITREPSLNVKDLRKLYTIRCEGMYLNLQAGIRQGDPQAIAVGLKVLEFEAKINNCIAAGRAKESIAQDDKGDEVAKSQEELAAEGAQYIDLFYEAVKILVDLGVPLPEPYNKPLSIETTAAPVQD